MKGVIASVGAIEAYMVDDHVRLDRLLADSDTPHGVDLELFGQFRHDLLRHIAMEEKVLLPYARSRRAGEPLPLAPALRRDHGEIAKLLVPTPTPATIEALRNVLGRHNALEEGPVGLYATCDALAGSEDASRRVVERLRAQPRVPVARYHDDPVRPRA